MSPGEVSDEEMRKNHRRHLEIEKCNEPNALMFEQAQAGDPSCIPRLLDMLTVAALAILRLEGEIGRLTAPNTAYTYHEAVSDQVHRETVERYIAGRKAAKEAAAR